VSRRPDPDRVVTARREAVLAWMRGAGVAIERALVELRKNEQWARAQGMSPREQRYWEAVRQLVGEEFG
jgi:hypothetical protein